MPAKDLYHEAVKNALIKDGWTITADPYPIEFEDAELYPDLAIKDEIYETFFQRKSIQAVIKRHQLDLLVVNIEKEEIVQWIN